MEYFKNIIAYQKLLKRFNSTYRDLDSIHSSMIRDNDAEHSYRVAMLCWMIIEKYNLKLDLNKVIKYSLIHDFVEVYAGDVSIYSNKKIDKHKRELKSLAKLKSRYPDLINIWKEIDIYEKRQDEEAIFVYIIEKIEPILTVLLSEDDHWLKRKVSFEDFNNRKRSKTSKYNSFAQYFLEDIMTYLDKHRKKWFV